ncbi:MAG: DUF2075 domain-containing protein [Candidatus Absconditabacteria bacterium]|nr:DUF2075 domain-containing protein [Candidatus Absconditabacteria bacterium]
MLVYNETKKVFLQHVSDNHIEDIIYQRVKDKLNRETGKSEVNSWKASLTQMFFVLNDQGIPDDSCISIEFRIPQTSKRIDFIITGEDDQNRESAIIIELKQWEKAKITDKDGLMVTRFQNGEAEVSHPSYQARSYARLLQNFNETVYQENIQLEPCAYLHNYEEDGIISNDFYLDYITKAPVFLKDDKDKLRAFIKKFVKYGDKKNTMFRIDHGKIKPSKHLADSMASMLKGNQEFVMIDDQKIVYENALALTKKSSPSNKNVLIVEGGPGTGKSVVAINLLVEITKQGYLTQYVTKNSAPRDVYHTKLTGSFRATDVKNMFSGSGSFVNCETNNFDALIVDEAHRLNEKSGMFKNLGENQIMEIIDAAKCSIFFVDEDQKVTLHDIGTKDEIIKRAKKIGANIHQLSLSSQFRCNGSDGYLAWLDDVLQIRETANDELDKHDYDFQIVSDPNKLRDIIFEKNKINNKARLVAGYCRNRNSKKNQQNYDIVLPEYDFNMRWNLAMHGNLRILKPNSVTEIGCIHTCQGLELDYVGVIVGKDLLVRNGKVETHPENRAKTDQSLKGSKKLLLEKPEEAQEIIDRIIKNTYRTLMTRGMKGCYVFFEDKETEEWFKKKIG